MVLAIQDKISKYYGNLDGTSYCGSRTYELRENSRRPNPDWVSLTDDTVLIESDS